MGMINGRADQARLRLLLAVCSGFIAAGCGDNLQPAGDGGLVDAAGVDAILDDDVAPEVGSGPSFTALTATSVTASWGAASDDVTPAAELRYKVVRAASGDAIDTLGEVAAITSGAALVLDFTADTLTVDVDGLTPATAYAFAVVVEDAAGNQALYAPATITTLDASAPIVGTGITFSGVAATSVTVQWGAATDDVTAAAALRYKLVRAAAASTIDTLAEVAAITSGAALVLDFTADTTTAPATGLTSSTEYAFAVVVEDAAGNQALYSPAVVSTLDVTAPTAGTAISFTNVATTSVTVQWGAATDDVTAAAALRYKLVRAAAASSIDTLAEVAAITSGAALVLDFTADTTAAPATGLTSSTAYAFAVVVEDAAGNQALYAPATVTTLDDSDPTVTITSPTSAATFPTAASTIALGGTASDNVGVASVSWANTTNATSGAATGTTSWSIASVTLAAGANTIVVTATDDAGNTATYTITVTRDNSDPTVTITSPTSAATFPTAASTIALGGTASDNVALASVSWANTTNATSGAATGTTTWSVASVTLAAGANTIVVTATDDAGNTATDTITVPRDNSDPTVTITSPTSAATYPTAASTIALGGTASDNVGVASVSWANTTNATTGAATGTTSWSIASVTLAAGANTIVVTAIDDAGNTATDTITVTRDNTDPTVTITSPTSAATFTTSASTIALGGTASDNVALASVSWANTTNATSGAATGTTSWSIASVTLAAGANTIVVTATDDAGNTATDTITVTRDNTDPTVTITSPTSAATFTTAASTIALDGTASDNVGVASVTWANTTNATSGAATGTTSWSIASVTLAAGANTIVVTATDDAGNTATDTITVTRAAARVTAVAAGHYHTCALLDDGRVKCWGNNLYGQLGLGNQANRGDFAGEMGDALPAVALGTGRTAVALTADAYHTCALLDDASVKCWGDNEFGQLGLGDTSDRGDGAGEMGDALPAVALGAGRTAVALAAGAGHTCALLDDASVKCWGHNGFGQLGLGDTANRGDAVGEMGDALPAIALGTGRTAVALTAGWYHTCARLDDASVKCWGYNSDGQLGLGDTARRGDAAGEMGDALPAVALGTGRTAVALAADPYHTCALLDDARVKCWGHNGFGQLGLGDTANRGDAVGEMGDALPAIALGTGRTAVALAGGYQTCAVLDDGRVKCWGDNRYGQLGLGDTAYRGDAAGEMGDALPAVALGTGRTAVALTASWFHTCAVLDDGRVKCWGHNGYGQLGLGDTAHRGDAAGEMGDALPAVEL